MSVHGRKSPKETNLHATHSGQPVNFYYLYGSFPASNGYKYIVTVICVFSKFDICASLRNKEAHTVSRPLVDHVFLKYGMSCDQGLEFENEIFSSLVDFGGY